MECPKYITFISQCANVQIDCYELLEIGRQKLHSCIRIKLSMLHELDAVHTYIHTFPGMLKHAQSNAIHLYEIQHKISLAAFNALSLFIVINTDKKGQRYVVSLLQQ
jgi:hypothetical protein